MDDCPRCGAAVVKPPHGWCACMSSWERIFAAAAYRRGIRDGVALAKRELNINYGHWGGQLTQDLDWSDVEREAAKLAGEGT